MATAAADRGRAVVRRGRREFVHLGTGNYNTRNARLYTDFSLFTADARLEVDGEAGGEGRAAGSNTFRFKNGHTLQSVSK